MWSTIFNPISGIKVNIHSKKGMDILKKYLLFSQKGSSNREDMLVNKQLELEFTGYKNLFDLIEHSISHAKMYLPMNNFDNCSLGKFFNRKYFLKELNKPIASVNLQYFIKQSSQETDDLEKILNIEFYILNELQIARVNDYFMIKYKETNDEIYNIENGSSLFQQTNAVEGLFITKHPTDNAVILPKFPTVTIGDYLNNNQITTKFLNFFVTLIPENGINSDLIKTTPLIIQYCIKTISSLLYLFAIEAIKLCNKKKHSLEGGSNQNPIQHGFHIKYSNIPKKKSIVSQKYMMIQPEEKKNMNIQRNQRNQRNQILRDFQKHDIDEYFDTKMAHNEWCINLDYQEITFVLYEKWKENLESIMDSDTEGFPDIIDVLNQIKTLETGKKKKKKKDTEVKNKKKSEITLNEGKEITKKKKDTEVKNKKKSEITLSERKAIKKRLLENEQKLYEKKKK